MFFLFTLIKYTLLKLYENSTVLCISFGYCMNRSLTHGDMIIIPYVTVLQVEDSGYCPATCQAFHCLFISGALSYGALAVRNFRPDYGRCRPLGIHCILRRNHLYSTPEVTEEHEIGKQLKHHSAHKALGTEKSSCFRERVCGTFLSNFCFSFQLFPLWKWFLQQSPKKMVALN